jgi:hypothetical protein
MNNLLRDHGQLSTPDRCQGACAREPGSRIHLPCGGRRLQWHEVRRSRVTVQPRGNALKRAFLLMVLSAPALASEYLLEPDYYNREALYEGKTWYEDVMLDYAHPADPDVELLDRCGRDLSFVECLQLKILLDRKPNEGK